MARTNRIVTRTSSKTAAASETVRVDTGAEAFVEMLSANDVDYQQRLNQRQQYDPAKAKQLLSAAGYPNGFQTSIMAPQGGISQQVTYATGVQSYLKTVGIDATMNLLVQSNINQLQLSGATWQGLAWLRFPTNPDWTYTMNSVYNGHGSYVNMLVPDDYSQAVTNGFIAPDDATKQKSAQEAMKLLIDKYALVIPEYSQLDSVTSLSSVHDTGLYAVAVGWTPEAAWLGKP